MLIDELPQKADIIIIGGGVMGASTAYHLSTRTNATIILLEKEEFFGQGATGRCAGGVRYQFGTRINIQLSLLSIPMFERFEDEIGQVVDYQKFGYLFLLTNDQDVEVFKNIVELQHSLGLQTQWLNGDEVRSMLPYMNLQDVIAATFYYKDGTVDPNSVVMGYINAAKRNGAKAINNVEVTQIQHKSGKVVGVNTTRGFIETTVVVNATGPWAGLLCESADFSIPLTPLRRQWIKTTPLKDLPDNFPFVIDFAQSLYFHREGTGLITGMSNPNENPGFSQNIDPQWELIHMDAAIKRLPMLSNAGLITHVAGLYEVTPDAHPIIGKTPIEGLYLITGFSGHGFMHGPITGLLMSEIILDGSASTLDISSLDLKRFKENRTIQEYNVI
ncbi:MAG: FAD-binding oxidoreductase [Anaerolineales bacterium]|nr:FAD-binding oxidoreductase [Anaerolineales bacterium]